jgi:hypothetical protein
MHESDGNGSRDHFAPDLDEEFPLGDGTADLAAMVECPYCGESIEITLDPGGGGAQDYVEDCEVCCQPWQVSVRYDHEGHAMVSVLPLTE